MKIKFLGTSSGWPMPRIGCNCHQCSSKNSKDKRTRASILIDDKILVDAGPDAYQHFIKYNIERYKALLLTHAHLDHTEGLWDISPRRVYKIREADFYAIKESFDFLEKFMELDDFNKKEIKREDSFKVDGLEVKSFPVKHSLDQPAVGFVFNDKVVYISDFRFIEEKYHKYLEGKELAILDGSCQFHPYPEEMKEMGHASMKESMALAEKLNVKKVIFTHIGHHIFPHKEMNKWLSKFEVEAETAYDGMEIKI